jgi:hypothetical protein
LSRHKQQDQASMFILKLGHDELIIRRRYQITSILNDFLIAVWFLIGSILFLFASLEEPGVWLFILGSTQLLIRPTIRLAGMIHLQKIPESSWES